MENDEILFFIEENNSKQIVKDKGLRFMGAYSYHQSSAVSAISSNEHVHIKTIKWISDLAQLLVHFSNNTIALISSRTMLKILAHHKYPDEYLKLWNEKRSVVSEKWVKLVEIRIADNAEEDSEQIVDFEVLNTRVNESSFSLTLAIFSSR
jgi:hypothetical protein